MTKKLKILMAFMRRDLLTEASYKFSFMLGIFYLLINLLIFYFIDKMFGHSLTAHTSTFGASYFSYVFLGIILFNFVGPGFSSLASKIRTEQYQGTFESLIASPLSPFELIIGLSAWNLAYSLAEFGAYVFIGALVFRIDFSNINVVSFLATLTLSILNFIAIGIISSCFVVIFKKGNPINLLLTPLEGILGGVYFPISVLPAGFQKISMILPITYSIKAAQLAVHKNASLSQIKTELFILAAFAIFLLPISLKMFEKSVKAASRTGQISNY